MVLLYELNKNDNPYSKERTLDVIKSFENTELLEYYGFYSKLKLKDDYDNFVFVQVAKEILNRMSNKGDL